MEEELVAWLLGSSDLTDLVERRVTFNTRPQASGLPYASIFVVSNLPDVAMDGRTGIAQARVQIDCWAKTYLAAKTVARAVDGRLAAVKHNEPTGPQSIGLQGAFPAGARDSFESQTGGVGDIYRVSLDYIIWSG